MSDLHAALLMIRSDCITGAQTFFIDKALSSSGCEEIPDADVGNVTKYIDLHLAHNFIGEDTMRQLARLHDALQAR